MNELKVGQQLWFVPSQRFHGESRFLTVSKVGRKWATTAEDRQWRIDVATLLVDGGRFSSPGKCYIDKAAHETEKARSAAWRNLVSRLSHQPNDGVSLDNIKEAARLLGLGDKVQEEGR